MDPLDLVRQATTTRTPVNYNGGFYIFGEHKLHESTKTKFKRSLKSGGYYTLRDAIFYLQHIEVAEVEYRRQCIKANVTAVVTQDKANLKQYLTGKIDTCPQLEEDGAVTASATAQSAAATGKEMRPGMGNRGVPQRSEEGERGLMVPEARARARTERLKQLLRQQRDAGFSERAKRLRIATNARSADREAGESSSSSSGKQKLVLAAASQMMMTLLPQDFAAVDPKSSGVDADEVASERALLEVLHYARDQSLGHRYNTVSAASGSINAAMNAEEDDAGRGKGRRRPRGGPTCAVDRSGLLCYPELGSVASSGGSGSSSDLSFVLQLFNEHVLRKASSGGSAAGGGSSKGSSKYAPAPPPGAGKGAVVPQPPAAPVARAGSGRPIIIVPTALTSLITAANVQEFLCSNHFVDPSAAAAAAQQQGTGKPVLHDFTFTTTRLPCFSTPGGGELPVRVRVVDNPLKLTDAEWDQVVAVFATGQAWQFKNWAPKRFRTPVELLRSVLGVHVMYDDRVVDPNIASWSCAVLKISRSQRHEDSVAVGDFWQLLNTHILHNKQPLIAAAVAAAENAENKARKPGPGAAVGAGGARPAPTAARRA